MKESNNDTNIYNLTTEEREGLVKSIEDNLIILFSRKINDYANEDDIKKVPASFLLGAFKHLKDIRYSTTPTIREIEEDSNIVVHLPKDWLQHDN